MVRKNTRIIEEKADEEYQKIRDNSRQKMCEEWSETKERKKEFKKKEEEEEDEETTIITIKRMKQVIYEKKRTDL